MPDRQHRDLHQTQAGRVRTQVHTHTLGQPLREGILTIEGLRREFNEIIEKKSKLSAGERQVVSNIVMAALRRASVKMQMEEQKKKPAQPAKKPQEAKTGDARADVPDGDRKGRREKISKK